MAKTESLDIIEPVSESSCAHHWIIGDPDGPTSSGKCKRCGTQRDFMNYFEVAKEKNTESVRKDEVKERKIKS